MNTSLPTDSAERKNYPLFRGLFGYFGAALGGVAHHSWKSNQKHNGDAPLHWSINQSTDHADCIARHLLDLGDLEARLDRARVNYTRNEPSENPRELMDAILDEANALAWRALALSQTLQMKYRGAPLPFNAKE